MRLTFVLAFLTWGSHVSFAQKVDDVSVKRLRVGVTAGFPNIVGLEAEYILPKWNDRFGVQLEHSYLPDILPSSETVIRYTSFGINGYLKNTGQGLYLGMDYGLLTVNATMIDNRSTDLRVPFQWINGKLGVKAGRRFYFRGELGYSIILFDIGDANEFLIDTYGIEVVPTLNFLHLPNLNLGIGYSF